MDVEAIVRSRGAVPATIAIMGGCVKIGLEREELEYLAKHGHTAIKCSRRDVAYCIAKKTLGSTTVAATSLLAAKAGIRVFVTGGIGGVHRGATETMDVSADLMEMGKCDIAVVCAGVKSLLDIGLTLEVLETQGVGVITMGQNSFPSFFTRCSGHETPMRLDTPEDVAEVIRASADLELRSGLLVAVPIPASEEAEAARVEEAIQQALDEARTGKVSGRDITPFLLKRVAELTGGASLRSNIALIKNNASVGSDIAVNLALKPGCLVVGGLAEDVYFLSKGPFTLGDSNPGTHVRSPGGVGRNVAVCMARIAVWQGARVPVALCSAVGAADTRGRLLKDELLAEGVDVTAVAEVPFAQTAMYSAMLSNDGQLVGAVMAAGEVFDKISKPVGQPWRITVVDCNLPESVIQTTCEGSKRSQVWIEPVSVAKVGRCASSLRARAVFGVSPNKAELAELVRLLGGSAHGSLEDQCKCLFEFGVEMVLLKLGKEGVLVAERGKKALRFEAPNVGQVVSVSGAGDCLLAAFLFGRLRGLTLDATMSLANQVVKRCLESTATVPVFF